MAKVISLQNVEKLIFEDAKLRRSLVNKKHLFHTWALSKQAPELRSMGQKATIELLNSLTEAELTTIGEYLGEAVALEKLETGVRHHDHPLAEAEEGLNKSPILKEAFFVYRDERRLYLATWR